MASSRNSLSLFESAKYDDDQFAFVQLSDLAHKNPPNKEALTLLGNCYHFGYAVDRSYRKAYLIYKKAADLGCDMAMYRLGRMFQHGLGVEPDFEMAAYWYYKSAKKISPKHRLVNKSVSQLKELAKDNPDPVVLNRLGFVFKYGYGVPKNPTKAVKFFAQSAEQGCDMGMYNLGFAYQHGLGVEKDLSIARYWFLESMKYTADENRDNNPSEKQIEKINREIQNNTINKPSDYDNQVVIDLNDGVFFGVNPLTRVWKWNSNRSNLCYVMRGNDLLEKTSQSHFPKDSKHLRIYISGHCWIGSNYMFFDDQEKKIRFNKMAASLADLIGDQNATISLMTCFGGKGLKQNAEDSFGAKLHWELVKRLKRDIPVVARTSYSSTHLYTNQQITFDLQELEKYKEDYALSIDISSDTSNFNLYKHHQPNSKVVFMLENNRQVMYDAYSGAHLLKRKWKDETLTMLKGLQKSTQVQSKKALIKGLIGKFDTLSAADIHLAIENEIKNEKSSIKNHSSHFLKFCSLFFKIRTNTEGKMQEMADGYNSISSLNLHG